MLVPIQVGTSMASSYKSLINLGKIFLRIFCIRNILQKTTLHVQRSFLYISLPLLLLPCETSSVVARVVEKMSYVLTKNFDSCFPVGFFFFSLQKHIFTLLTATISYFLNAVTKFSCCFSNENRLLCFLSLSLALCRPFSCWASLACRLPLVCLSLSLYSKFEDMKINLRSIL